MTGTPPPTRQLRPDIQALRALAVALVVVYHLFPGRLTGGFVGVDSFFLISGFLITLHLIERPPTSGGDLLAFWARRVRRLLPASLTVLAATLGGAWLFLPDSQWETTGVHVRAAALYVANWQLAADAVDYLAAEAAPSPVQHFWSLGVEEQFYLGWPILLLLLTVLVPGRRRMLGYWVGLGAVVLGSLAWSVHLTATDPAAAYFVTWTRLWELGVGGLVALMAPAAMAWARGHRRLAGATALIGWAMVLVAAVSYTDTTPFPGWQAALPVVGTALVIASHSDMRWHRFPGVQWLGDVSYAVYLWHWPLIVIAPPAVARFTGTPERGLLDALLIVVLTLVLAALTKTFVEDRFRTPTWSRRVVPSIALGGVGMVAVVALALLLVQSVHQQQREDQAAVAQVLDGTDPCAGAAALDPARDCAPPEGPLVPSPVLAAKDKSAAYEKRSDVARICFSEKPDFPMFTCEFGDPQGDVDVALVGNSHAGHWLPALEEIGAERGWRITGYLASSCTSADVDQEFDTLHESQECTRWVKEMADQVVADHPDLIVVSNRTGRPSLGRSTIEESIDDYAEGFRRTLETLVSTGIPVVVIRDTPIPIDGGIENVPDCLALHDEDRSACSGPRSDWVAADPSVAAAEELADRGVTVVDPTDWFCNDETCWSAIGGVIVYFDGHHVTATYARTIAPYLAPFLLGRID